MIARYSEQLFVRRKLCAFPTLSPRLRIRATVYFKTSKNINIIVTMF